MTEVKTLALPDTKEIDTEAHAVVARANRLTIDTADDARDGDALLGVCATMQRRAKELMRPAIDSAHAAHKAALAAEKNLIEPFKRAELIVGPKLLAFRRRAEDEARKKADELRRKQQEEIERTRLAQAEALEARGAERDEVDAVLAAPLPAPAPVVVAADAPKLEASSGVQTTWRFEVVDANLIPRAFMCPDEAKIGGVVRSLKADAAATIPGIRVWSEEKLKVKRT